MCSEELYSFLRKISLKALDIIRIRNFPGGLKPLSIEDILWHRGEKEIYDPFTLYNARVKGINSLSVYSQVYIGLGARHDLDFLYLLRDISKTVGLRPLILGMFDIEEDRRRRLYNVSNIGIYVDEDVRNGSDLGRVRFDLINDIIIVDRGNALKMLLYVLRPLIAYLGYSPLLLFPISIVDPWMGDEGIYLLNRDYEEVDEVSKVYYIGVSIHNKLYVEDLRGVTIPRYQT